MIRSPSTAAAHRPVTGPSARVDKFAEEMVARWRRGERPLVEEFLERDPESSERPEDVFELLAEELVLRTEHWLPTTAEELGDRFPHWRTQVAALLDCHRELGPHLSPPAFPIVGDDLGDFHLLAELGRGAHGRVFLASQPALSDRQVVLKLGPWAGGEHLSLARLQHTHIVPLYSAHEFPDLGLRALCLPYFGGATLAALLADGSPAAGKDLLARLVATDDPPMRGPAWAFLEQATAIEAVCWIGACLADALQYAHDRALLHLDLKPSNVLLASDGTPMLLDFHLARSPLHAGDAAPQWLGGTVGYMAPEQVAAMRAVTESTTLPQPVDARADVFALGVLLTECFAKLSGRASSLGLADIVARATAPEPRDRYASAAELATDLRRHLSDLPLRGVSNRSLSERWAKWRRRRPYALPLMLTLAALLTLCIGLILQSGRQVSRAKAALREGETHLASGRYREAADAFSNGEMLIDGVPFQPSLRQRLRDAKTAADRGQTATEIHRLCEQVRPLYAAEDLSLTQARAAAAQCRALWTQRAAFAQLLAGTGAMSTVQVDLLDLGILTAYLEVRVAAPDGIDAAHRQAKVVLSQAEVLCGPSTVLHLERSRHAAALGQIADFYESMKLARKLTPRTAWEYLAVGRHHLSAGHLANANTALDSSLELDPQSVWANYYKGVCCLRANQPTEAVAAFSACVALSPGSAWCWHNRALAFEKAGRRELALADLRRAVQLDPENNASRELLNKLAKP
jgi:eukaryotic-like serine/threonine-protein kinase